MRLISEIKNVANDVVPTIHIHSQLVAKRHLDLLTSHKFLIIVCFSMSYTSVIEHVVTEGYFTKHANITTTYKDN
jgi:hypothetical protein